MRGVKIEDEEMMREAARDYIKGGGSMWATIFDTCISYYVCH